MPKLKRRLRAIPKSSALCSDIRYHLLLEESLYTVFSTLDISADEAEAILSVITQAPSKHKKRLFKSNKSSNEASLFLRQIVRAQLNYLLIKADLEALREKLELAITEQQDIHSISYHFPESLDAKALSPEKAINSLTQLLEQTESALESHKKSLSERQAIFNRWLTHVKSEVDNFCDNHSNNQGVSLSDTLSPEQKNELLRIISGITPNVLLYAEPNKDDANYALFQKAKKLARGR